MPVSSPLDFYLTVADQAPADAIVTDYDRQHFPTYARIADASTRDWRQAARVILGRDAQADPEGAWACWSSHAERARWILSTGWRLPIEDMSWTS